MKASLAASAPVRDLNHYWGTEMRLAWGANSVYYSERSKEMRAQADTNDGLAPDDPARNRYDGRFANLCFWDVDLLYYPCGDAAVRPYALVGMGTTHLRYTDEADYWYSKYSFSAPIAIGVKYRCNEWLALRLELNDDIAFPTHGKRTLHDMSLTTGLEYRFGGTRKAYWPWNPGKTYW